MEEADILASRVAIISQRILAIGTTDFLRRKHGNIYHVHLVLDSAPTSTRGEMETVERWVERSFFGAVFDPYGNDHGQIRFSVPLEPGDEMQDSRDCDHIVPVGEAGQERHGRGIGAVFAMLEREKGKVGLRAYTVRATTMDEIFLKVIRENNVQEDGTAEKGYRQWWKWKGRA
jgi:hypothetical protein